MIELEHITSNVVTRFWQKVRITDTCWLWTAALRGLDSPYGVISVRVDTWEHVEVPAHVLSFMIHTKTRPKNKVLHTCDVTSCVRPDHLYDGTPLQNVRDMINRGRRKSDKGADNPMSVLTDADIAAIRSIGASKFQREIAMQFGITQSAVSNILNRKSWQHV